MKLHDLNTSDGLAFKPFECSTMYISVHTYLDQEGVSFNIKDSTPRCVQMQTLDQ